MKKTVMLMVAIAFLCGSMGSAQTVYYNTEGGRYYHADPRCDTISEKYWNSMAEISEGHVLEKGLKGSCHRCFNEEAILDTSNQLFSISTTNTTPAYLRFGGSQPDQINDLALTKDGRIVMAGATASSDGTLSDRTKSGRSGWVALVDLQGKTYWNFCSRHGNSDLMESPVVHDDNTITVLLRSDGNEYDQMELIRLDMDGNVVNRKTLMKIPGKSSGCAPEWPGIFAGGYVIATFDLSNKIDFEPLFRFSDGLVYQPVYHWFDFDGNLLFKTQSLWQDSVAQVSKNHVIEAIDQSYWLCSLDEKGNRTQLVKLYDGLLRNIEYHDLVSLDDGGVLACCYQSMDGNAGSLIQQWDSQGKLKMEIGIKGFYADRIQIAADRIIACGSSDNMGQTNEMLVLNYSGEVIGRHTLNDVSSSGESVLVLDGNRIVMAEQVIGRQTDSDYTNWDAQIGIIDIAQ